MESTAESLFAQGRALVTGGNRDPERAVVLLAGAADLGHGGACLVLGRQLGNDPEAAMGWLWRGVELGDDECRYEVAVRLLMGLGTTVDEVAAAELLQTAAEHGHEGAAGALAGLRRRQASRSRTPQASLQAAVAEFGLQEYGDRIAAAALPSARLVGTVSGEDPPVGASRIGGAPDLSEGVDWPAGAGGPLSFVAQVDLAAVAECLPNTGLPRDGLLSFFYDAETQPWGLAAGDRSGWQVVLTVDTGSLRRRAAPDEVVAFRPVTLTAWPELTVPFGRTMEGRGFDLDAGARDRYFELQAVFADDFAPQDGGRARHRMLGHPDAIQGDMRRRIEGVLRGGVDLDAAETPELDEAAKRWVLLLQVDSDDDAELMWATPAGCSSGSPRRPSPPVISRPCSCNCSAIEMRRDNRPARAGAAACRTRPTRSACPARAPTRPSPSRCRPRATRGWPAG